MIVDHGEVRVANTAVVDRDLDLLVAERAGFEFERLERCSP
jgi:hypothetical protein